MDPERIGHNQSRSESFAGVGGGPRDSGHKPSVVFTSPVRPVSWRPEQGEGGQGCAGQWRDTQGGRDREGETGRERQGRRDRERGREKWREGGGKRDAPLLALRSPAPSPRPFVGAQQPCALSTFLSSPSVNPLELAVPLLRGRSRHRGGHTQPPARGQVPQSPALRPPVRTAGSQSLQWDQGPQMWGLGGDGRARSSPAPAVSSPHSSLFPFGPKWRGNNSGDSSVPPA